MGYKLILIDGKWKRFYGTMKEAREYLEKHKKTNEKRRIKKMKLWCRIGATLYLNEKEAELLLNGDNNEAKDLLKRMIYDNRFRLDGESYIPESAITDFNEKYDKHYQEDEYEYIF